MNKGTRIALALIVALSAATLYGGFVTYKTSDVDALEMAAVYDETARLYGDAGDVEILRVNDAEDVETPRGICAGGAKQARFAVATMLTDTPSMEQYSMGVRKLGESIKRWSWSKDFQNSVDMILLLVEPLNAVLLPDPPPFLHLETVL